MPAIVLIRGGGDLASGAALRLHRAGLRVVITEIAQPLVVRRRVAFAEAIYQGHATVEGVIAQRVRNPIDVYAVLAEKRIPVLVDPKAESRHILQPVVLVDGRMTKHPPELGLGAAGFVIGLGPGFIANKNCHAVIETQRGHNLGRVIWQGAAQPDSGIPESVADRNTDRVLRAPCDGLLQAHAEIGDVLEAGQTVADVSGQVVAASFKGLLRGLIHPGVWVWRGLKIGDVDPRQDPTYATLVSDKSMAIAGGVMEAILGRPALRRLLWE